MSQYMRGVKCPGCGASSSASDFTDSNGNAFRRLVRLSKEHFPLPFLESWDPHGSQGLKVYICRPCNTKQMRIERKLKVKRGVEDSLPINPIDPPSSSVTSPSPPTSPHLPPTPPIDLGDPHTSSDDQPSTPCAPPPLSKISHLSCSISTLVIDIFPEPCSTPNPSLPRLPLAPSGLDTTLRDGWPCDFSVARDVMMMEKGEFDKWRGHVVCLVGAVCEALAQCKIPEVRLVKEKLITKDQWDRLLSMERYERAQVWSEKGWLNVQVTDECAVWVDFPIVPTACREMGRQRWMEIATTLSRSASSESTITNTEVDLIDLHPQEPRAGRRRTGRKDLVEPRMTKVTKAAIYTKEPQLLAWSSRAGLSAGEWMSLQGWQQRQLFSGAQQWPSEMSVSSDYLNGNTSTVFVTDGPCSTSQHIDGISGASSMMEGWKVFMWWNLDDHHRLVEGRPANQLDGPISVVRAIDCPSLTLLGPGATISIPAHVPHAVVTLSASFLCTWVIVEAPHSLIRTFDYMLRRRIADPFWTATQGNGDPKRGDFSNLLRVLYNAMRSKVEYYQSMARDRPDLRPQCIDRLAAMRNGWRLHGCNRFLLPYFSAAVATRDAALKNKVSTKSLNLCPIGHDYLLKEEEEHIGSQCKLMVELMEELEDFVQQATEGPPLVLPTKRKRQK